MPTGTINATTVEELIDGLNTNFEAIDEELDGVLSEDVNGDASITRDLTVGRNLALIGSVIGGTIDGDDVTLLNVPADQLDGEVPVASGGTGALTPQSAAVNLGTAFVRESLTDFKALTSRPLIVVHDGSNWTWFDGDSTTANDTATKAGTILAPTGGPSGRYKRNYDGVIAADWVAEGDGVANDTTAVAAAAAAALAAGVWLDGRGKTYGVSELSLPVGLKARNIRFKELSPQGSNDRKTVKCIGTGAAAETLTLEDFYIDRNGDGTAGSASAAGLWVEDVASVSLIGEVTGNGIGNGVVIDTALRGSVDLYVHDIRYVHVAQIDDQINGVWFNNCAWIHGFARVDSLGRTDLTTVERDRYSRGVVYGGCSNMTIFHEISRVEQGCDVTGSAGNRNVSLAGNYSHLLTVAAKVANTAIACDFHLINAEHCGLAAVFVSAPDSVLANLTQAINVSGWTARNIGTNGFWSGLGVATAGCKLDTNSADAVLRRFPKGCLIENFHCFSDRGSSAFTVSGDTLTLASGIPISTGTRVRVSTSGTLPSPLVAGTDYYLIRIPDTLTAQLATSYINALDGVEMDLTTAGTGTHTITLQSDCDYAVYSNIAVADWDANMPNRMRPGLISGLKLGMAGGNVQLLGKELLIADRNYFVRADGADTNTGLVNSAAGAFLTPQKALDVIHQTLDLGGKTASIFLAAGTYTAALSVTGPFTGQGGVAIVGDNATPSNVKLTVAGNALSLSNGAALTVSGIQFSTTGSGSAIVLTNGARVRFAAVDFAAVIDSHISVGAGCVMELTGDYTISGGGFTHLTCNGGRAVTSSRTVTISSTPAFSGAYVFATRAGVIVADLMTFSGSATGARYAATMNGVIDTAGGGGTYFPGDSAGSTATGGQYA